MDASLSDNAAYSPPPSSGADVEQHRTPSAGVALLETEE